MVHLHKMTNQALLCESLYRVPLNFVSTCLYNWRLPVVLRGFCCLYRCINRSVLSSFLDFIPIFTFIWTCCSHFNENDGKGKKKCQKKMSKIKPFISNKPLLLNRQEAELKLQSQAQCIITYCKSTVVAHSKA